MNACGISANTILNNVIAEVTHMEKKKNNGTNPGPTNPKPEYKAPGYSEAEAFAYDDPFLSGEVSDGCDL